MIDPAIFFPLIVMGLVSSTHCIGMCGGIMGALTMAIPASAKAQRWKILVAYNLGRILSYAFMGMLAGLFAEQFAAMGGGAILRVLAGVLLIAMGLYLADWWRGLTKLENLGRYLWVYIQPIGKGLMPVDNLPKALLLGALWGWLPCGLVYAALATAMTQPAPGLAAGAMFAFGLGTLPAVLASGIATQQLTRLLQQRQLRFGMAIVIILFGLWTIWGSLGHGHNHQHHDSMSNEDRTATDHSTMDHSAMDHAYMNHEVMNHEAEDHSQMDHSQMDHTQMDHTQMNHTQMNHTQMNHTQMNHATMNQVESNVDENASSSASSASLERQRTELNQAPVEDSLHSGSSSEGAGKTLDHHH